MAVFHDEVEIEDFEYDEETETYSYPCPCGDRFLITRVTAGGDEGEAALGVGRAGRCVTVSGGLLQEDLENGEDVATCPSCSLILRVIYDQVGAGRGWASHFLRKVRWWLLQASRKDETWLVGSRWPSLSWRRLLSQLFFWSPASPVVPEL